ncbi:MAG: hypothetical protein U0W40_16915 [Acidimicrobiia bacterium]
MTPAASRRRKKSSSDSAPAAASIVSAARPSATTGSGCTTARFNIHGSRGRTHTMSSGATPLRSSHTIASVAVLPEPTITYAAAVSNLASSCTGITARRRRT